MIENKKGEEQELLVENILQDKEFEKDIEQLQESLKDLQTYKSKLLIENLNTKEDFKLQGI